jgi:hypothetical protein
VVVVVAFVARNRRRLDREEVELVSWVSDRKAVLESLGNFEDVSRIEADPTVVFLVISSAAARWGEALIHSQSDHERVGVRVVMNFMTQIARDVDDLDLHVVRIHALH